jgi:DNA-binding response OmpR family regulator
MLTARDAAPDIIRGLDAGADDYLTKPFSLQVLLARLRAVSRRAARPLVAQLQVDRSRLAGRSTTSGKAQAE